MHPIQPQRRTRRTKRTWESDAYANFIHRLAKLYGTNKTVYDGREMGFVHELKTNNVYQTEEICLWLKRTCSNGWNKACHSDSNILFFLSTCFFKLNAIFESDFFIPTDGPKIDEWNKIQEKKVCCPLFETYSFDYLNRSIRRFIEIRCKAPLL